MRRCDRGAVCPVIVFCSQSHDAGQPPEFNQVKWMDLAKWSEGKRCQASRLAFHTPRTSHLTPRTSHLAPHTSHLAPHTSHLTPRTSHLTFDQELLRQRNRAGHARAPGTTALQPAPSLASRRPHAAPLSRAQVNGLRDAHALLLGMQRELAAIKQVYKRMCHIRRHTSHVTPLQPLQKLWTMRNGYCMPDSLDALRISWYILLLLLLLLLPLLQRLIYDTRAHAQTPVSVV